MGEAALKKIEDLETEVAKLMIDLELEKQVVAQLISQIETMAAAEVERRNHRVRENFEWFE